MTNEKVIPKDIWKQLKEYWDNTYYEELSEKKLKDILGNPYSRGSNLFI